MSALPSPPLRLSLVILGLGAMLYHIGFFQRVAPAVLTTELTHDFSLSATALGNLSSIYFYSYVVMQVPTGLLADHWGPRKLLTMGACIASVGGAVFAMAPDVWWASVGRLLIGGSVAVAFVGMLKLAEHWLPGRHYALVSGMALLVGILGAVFAGFPLRRLVDIYDWRLVMLLSAMGTLAWAFIIWWFVRDDPSERGYASYTTTHDTVCGGESRSVCSAILTVFREHSIWLFFLVPGGVVGCIISADRRRDSEKSACVYVGLDWLRHFIGNCIAAWSMASPGYRPVPSSCCDSCLFGGCSNVYVHNQCTSE